MPRSCEYSHNDQKEERTSGAKAGQVRAGEDEGWRPKEKEDTRWIPGLDRQDSEVAAIEFSEEDDQLIRPCLQIETRSQRTRPGKDSFSQWLEQAFHRKVTTATAGVPGRIRENVERILDQGDRRGHLVDGEAGCPRDMIQPEKADPEVAPSKARRMRSMLEQSMEEQIIFANEVPTEEQCHAQLLENMNAVVKHKSSTAMANIVGVRGRRSKVDRSHRSSRHFGSSGGCGWT